MTAPRKERIKKLRVRGMRTLVDVEFELAAPVTVLIGENGTGKSSLLEALELLRGFTDGNWLERWYRRHGGFRGLGVADGGRIELGVRFGDGVEEDLEYAIALRDLGGAPGIEEETAGRSNRARVDALRKRTGRPPLDPRLPFILQGEDDKPAVSRAVAALRGIEVHVPFDATASWAAEGRVGPGPRDSQVLAPASRLALGGDNLVNVFHALKNGAGRQRWDAILDDVRLGIGPDVDDIVVDVSTGGVVGLSLVMRGRAIPIVHVSAGELAYLGFVALAHLTQGRSVLAFDEPELHLHPGLVARVVGLLESAATDQPVIVATHSDRILDMVGDHVRAVVVCEREGSGATALRRLDPELLERWIARYRGLGDLVADGELSAVVRRSAGAA